MQNINSRFLIQLSARELDCLRLAAEDKSVVETSAMLELSVSTVKSYRSNILNKTGCQTIAGALWRVMNKESFGE